LRICTLCQSDFEFTDLDRELCEKYDIPESPYCSDCRQQRRLIFRNERHLYSRKCDKCEQSIISIYSPDKNLTVYCPDCWWGDGWDSTDQGQEIDWDRPFFEQMKELLPKAPLLSNMVFSSVNCEYNAYTIDAKDCYLSARVQGENVMYSYLVTHSNDIVDSFNIFQSERLYQCIDMWNCYNCNFTQLAKNCSDCSFCYDCIGCKNCFGSVGLRNKEHVFFNKQCTPEEYEQYLEQYSLEKYGNIKKIREKFYEEVILKKPIRDAYIVQSEDAHGNYISESQRVYNSYDVEKSQDVSNSWGVEYSKDVHYGSFNYYGENTYENISNAHGSNVLFSFAAINSNDIRYGILNFNNSQDCFACISIKQKKYNILNKQYSKEEYEALLPKLIEHMKSTGEWGQFMSPDLSCFDYNETPAMEYFPLTKSEALEKGFSWHDESEQASQEMESDIPENIKECSDELCKKFFSCEGCQKAYKIIPAELKFYQDQAIAPPHQCSVCRHKARVKQRNPRKLWERNCNKCQKGISTSYAPGRKEMVYCEQCYLKEMY
jgi:hypothetical protein